MNIKSLKVGYLETNCYLLELNGNVIIIDPGDDFNNIIKEIGKSKVVGIIITHYHFDHVSALEELKDKYKVEVYDINNLKEGHNNIGEFNFDVIYTPGHKEDSICIYFKDKKVMFTGDFIFRGSIGRWDFPGGNIKEMIKSISKVIDMDSDIIIYPGHGEDTTLGDEKSNLAYYLKHF